MELIFILIIFNKYDNFIFYMIILYFQINNTNLWPPFSVSASPMQDSNQCITTSAFAGNVMPVYYIVQSGQPPQEHPGPPPYSREYLALTLSSGLH